MIQEIIHETHLCESRFVPQPNKLYRYIVADGCEACEALAQWYKVTPREKDGPG